MNIVFIGLRGFPPIFKGVSGVETRTELIINHFSKKNNVYIFTRKWTTYTKKGHTSKNIIIIPVFTIKNKYLDTFIYSFLASIKSCFIPGKIIFYESTASSFFCFIPRIFGKKVVSTIHSIEYDRKKWGFLSQLVLYISEVLTCSFSNKIIVISDFLNRHIRSKYGIKAITIKAFMDQKNKIPLHVIKKKFGLANKSYVLFLGRFSPEKRIELLIHAFREIKTNKKLVLAGGLTHDISYYKYILSLIKNDKNIVHTNYVFGKEKEELISNCSLLVIPSETEGVPMALFDALSYRKNVLIGNFPIFKNISIYPEHFYKIGSYKNFLNKLEYMLNHKISFHLDFYKGIFSNKKTFIDKYDQIIESF